MKRIISFIKECIQEMKKVSWPTRDEVTNSTRVVVISVALIAMLLGAIDYLLFRIINLVL